MKDIILYIALIILLGISCTAIYQCHRNNDISSTNIKALTDSITYYRTHNDDIVAVKTAFSARADELKQLNKNLYDKIKSLDVKPKTITNTVYMQGETEFLPQDTAWVVRHDTLTNIIYNNGSVYRDFAFNDRWRDLEGYVKYSNDTLGLSISKDIVRFDYTVAMDKNNKIYVKSDNPYVKYSEISGFQVPKQRTKMWGIGPQVGITYDPVHNKIAPTFGIGIQWSPIRF